MIMTVITRPVPVPAATIRAMPKRPGRLPASVSPAMLGAGCAAGGKGGGPGAGRLRPNPAPASLWAPAARDPLVVECVHG